MPTNIEWAVVKATPRLVDRDRMSAVAREVLGVRDTSVERCSAPS